MTAVINIRNGRTRMPAWRMAEPVNFSLFENEHLAIVGPNGGGKSMFVDILRGAHPLVGTGVEYHFPEKTHEYISDDIKYISFRDTYGTGDDRVYYLQQRWNQHDIRDDDPETIFYSSGELRKWHLRRALSSKPQLLIIDNPFIGLDAKARTVLSDMLKKLCQTKTQVILVLSKVDDIPSFITHVVEVSGMIVHEKTTRDEYLRTRPPFPKHMLTEDKKALINGCGDPPSDLPPVIAQMRNVSIRYGKRTILKDLNWTVRKGEHWALTGDNGSGKSTLLSLVCADNPQSYACDITLFGKARGTGESIWDIKKHIGYVSPEMHRAYSKDLPLLTIIASGLKDSVGLYVKPTPQETDRCRLWAHIFGLDGLLDRTFLHISSGEQRLALLARAFVKNPDLIILDEPFHGLDNINRRLAKDIIETYSGLPQKTLIMVTHYKEEFPSVIDHELHLLKN